jgi:hypothetical protein
MIAIMKKQLKIEGSLYKILQILSVHVFEKLTLYQLLTETECKTNQQENPNQ